MQRFHNFLQSYFVYMSGDIAAHPNRRKRKGKLLIAKKIIHSGKRKMRARTVMPANNLFLNCLFGQESRGERNFSAPPAFSPPLFACMGVEAIQTHFGVATSAPLSREDKMVSYRRSNEFCRVF